MSSKRHCRRKRQLLFVRHVMYGRWWDRSSLALARSCGGLCEGVDDLGGCLVSDDGGEDEPCAAGGTLASAYDGRRRVGGKGEDGDLLGDEP
jgi:hypothetical protein